MAGRRVAPPTTDTRPDKKSWESRNWHKDMPASSSHKEMLSESLQDSIKALVELSREKSVLRKDPTLQPPKLKSSCGAWSVAGEITDEQCSPHWPGWACLWLAQFDAFRRQSEKLETWLWPCGAHLLQVDQQTWQLATRRA